MLSLLFSQIYESLCHSFLKGALQMRLLYFYFLQQLLHWQLEISEALLTAPTFPTLLVFYKPVTKKVEL